MGIQALQRGALGAAGGAVRRVRAWNRRSMTSRPTSTALVINAGSSSLKYALFSVRKRAHDGFGGGDDELLGTCERVAKKSHATQLASGIIAEIGGQSVVTHKKTGDDSQTVSNVAGMPDHAAAFSEMIRHLTSSKSGLIRNVSDIGVVGHRVVHGADMFSKSVVIDQTVEAAIEDACKLAPLHNPANLLGIREAKDIFPCPHVAVFDTAFHSSMPPVSYTYAIPLDLAERHKIRRYGFHGTSYCYVLQQTAERLGKRSADLNTIICHLGNGTSMACVEKGVCIDTSMGLTPLEGLVMGSRCGDLDPGIFNHLTREQGLTPLQVDELLNKGSGLMGLCGDSNMESIIASADAGEANATLALNIFVQRVRKYLGSYMVRLNGHVDAIVFTAGIGQNSDRIRAMVCEGLEPLGVSLDAAKNGRKSISKGGTISTSHSYIKVMVVPTDEELAIALQSVEAAHILDKPAAAVSDSATPRKPSPFSKGTDGNPPPPSLDSTKPEAEEGGDGGEASQAVAVEAAGEGGAVVSEVTDASLHPIEGSPGVYLAASNRSMMSDSSVPEVGLMYALENQVRRLGYFRPIAYHENDRRLDLIKRVFQIEDQDSEMYGVTMRKAVYMLAHGDEDALIQEVMAKFDALHAKHDFIIVGGLNQGEMPGGAQDLNSKFADALNLPIIWSTDAASFPRPGASRVQTILEEIELVRPKGELKHLPLAGVIATEVPRERIARIRDKLTSSLEDEKIKTLAVMPVDPRIRIRTLREVANVLGASVLCGHEQLDSNHVGKMIVGTLQVSDLLHLISNRHAEEASVAPELDGLAPAEIEDCRKAFEKFDKHKNGLVNTREIPSVMRALGWDVSLNEVQMIMSENEELENESDVTFLQFMSLLSQQKGGHDPMPGGSVLVVTHVGRVDVLLSLLMASKSPDFPKIGGILLTDGSRSSLSHEVLDILAGNIMRVPVLTIPLDTFEATQRIHGLHGIAPRLLPTSSVKLRAAQELFAANVCQDFLHAIVRGKDLRHEMTSRHFLYHISQTARQHRQHIVLPEGEDARVVQAAAELLDRGLCDVTILGNIDAINGLAADHGVDVSRAQIVDPPESPDFELFVAELVKQRAKKGMTDPIARNLLTGDFTWFGVMMMHLGLCDGMVSGACHTTADTMRPALQVIKTSKGTSLVSSVMFMLLPERVFLFGDCAINVDPSSEDLCQIGISCAETAEAFEIEPRVAMLSYATGESNTGPIVDKVRKATELAREKKPNLLIEGPTQFDAAVDMEVAQQKNKGSSSNVLGRATVCVFPDLNSGNNTYKAVQQAARCIAVGPIMQGLRLPVNDLSRGCTVNDIVNTVIITCNQAISAKLSPPKE